MKIAVICNKTNNEEMNARHSGYHFAWGFQQLGDTVDVFGWRDQHTITKTYDLYFCVDSSENYALRDDLHPLAVYNGDTHMPGGMERDFERCKNADLIFNGNFENGVELMRLMGLKSIWLPLGFDARFDFSEEDISEKDVDVAMVGNPNSPERVQLWDFLKESYPNSLVGNIDPREAYRRAKIVVNQPTMPWDIIYNNRLLEAMASGCLVLQKELKVKKHEILFPEEIHPLIWHDLSDLKFKIDQTLSFWPTMRFSGITARNYVIKNFSYRNLCQIIKNYVVNL